jgi:uncharacterized protein (TIGR02186 family)
MILRLIAITTLVLFFRFTAEAQQKLVADLNQKNVEISTDFNGAELLLFGALDRASVDDIAIIVTGPPKTVSIRRKEKIAGIWLNTENADVVGLPSFYHIHTTRPLEDIASENTLKVNKIGFGDLRFKLAPDSSIDEGPLEEWELALVRNMKKTGLWHDKPETVEVISDVLFRADITLPANILPGEYEVRTIHFRGGAVIEDSVTTLTVEKSGLSASIFFFAHQYAPIYGIFAIIFAVLSGWIAAVAFRK